MTEPRLHPVPAPDPVPARRRVSRETRQLLTAALIALVTLWVLARIRFPDAPANPLPTLLSLSPASRHAELADEIAELQSRLSASLLVVSTAPTGTRGPSDPTRPSSVPALRVGGDVAIAVAPGAGAIPGGDVLAADEVTGLTVIRVRPGPSGAVAAPWTSPALDQPRYLMRTVVSPRGVSLQPILIGAVHQLLTAAWPEPVWAVPAGTDLAAGAFVFTTSGELAGVVSAERDVLAIVPGDVVLAEAARLLEQGPRARGALRVRVRALTPDLALATGASHGVVVSWVDPDGPSAGQLIPGDVIESFGGRPMLDMQDWDTATGRLGAGDDVSLRVRRGGVPVELAMQAARRGSARPADEPRAPPGPLPLGLTLRREPDAGSRVVEVEPDSAAARAGLQAGDLITVIAGASAPTPAFIEDAFAATAAGEAIVVAYTRDDAHDVLALVR